MIDACRQRLASGDHVALDAGAVREVREGGDQIRGPFGYHRPSFANHVSAAESSAQLRLSQQNDRPRAAVNERR